MNTFYCAKCQKNTPFHNKEKLLRNREVITKVCNICGSKMYNIDGSKKIKLDPDLGVKQFHSPHMSNLEWKTVRKVDRVNSELYIAFGYGLIILGFGLLLGYIGMAMYKSMVGG